MSELMMVATTKMSQSLIDAYLYFIILVIFH